MTSASGMHRAVEIGEGFTDPLQAQEQRAVAVRTGAGRAENADQGNKLLFKMVVLIDTK